MKKNKGFTLIELLAVIVILAVIALIATPIIMNVIEDSKKGAAKDSVYNYLDAITYSVYKTSNGMDFGVSNFQVKNNGNLINESNEEITIDSKGTRPTDGYVTINSNGKIGAAIIMDNYCIIKHIVKDEVAIYDDKTKCNKDIASNMFVNGYGELKNNTNFSSFDYNSDGSFSKNTSSYITQMSDEFIPVNTNNKYQLSADFKSDNSNLTYYAGFAEYDIDKLYVDGSFVSYMPDTLTTLTQDLNNGDTIVHLESTAKFNLSSTVNQWQRGLIFWNYKDSTGHLYESLTYSRNVWSDLYTIDNVDKVNNTIKLKVPWNRGTFKAGTKLSQSNVFGPSYNYGLLYISKLTNTYQTKTVTVNGVLTGYNETYDKFRYPTKYIRFLTLNNFQSDGTGKLSVRNVLLKEVK